MTYAILTLLFTATFVVSPAFSSFSGFEANQLPIPQIDPPVQPAGYAFAIWGLIYAWLAVSAIFGVAKRGDDPDWDKARKPLILSLLVGTPWLYIATQSPLLATLAIIVMALTAIVALIRAPRATDRWLFQAPVAIYAGWLTAATFVSIGSTMAGYGVLMGSWGWAVVCIVAALVVAIAVYRQRPDAPEYLLTVVWALVGIIVANGLETLSITALAAAGIAALLAAVAARARISPARPVS